MQRNQYDLDTEEKQRLISMASDFSNRDIHRHMTAAMVVLDVYPQIMREMIANQWSPKSVLKLIEYEPNNSKSFSKNNNVKRVVSNLETNGYQDLDISLLYNVIRHFGLLKPPAKGWGKIPIPGDQNEGDDIERIRIYRNDVLHRPRGGLSESERNTFFEESIEIARRMDNRIGSPSNGFESRIEKFKTDSFASVDSKLYKEALEKCAKYKEKLPERADGPSVILYFGNDIKIKLNARKDQENSDDLKEVTMGLIKPDAVKNGQVDQILGDIREAGFEILRHEERILLTSEVREQIYSQLQAEKDFEDLVRFMTSGPSYVFALTKGKSGENVIEEFRNLIGPTNVEEAKEQKPESLRAKYGHKTFMNALHGSSSSDMVTRELDLFFPGFEVPSVKRKADTEQTTLALLRPKAFTHCKDDILNRIRESGFNVTMQKDKCLTKEEARKFYVLQKDQEYFDQLVAYMSSGPVLALGLTKKDAIEGWRNLLGPKDVCKAKEEAPDCLRVKFAMDGAINSLHGSDSEDTAEKELQFFFPMEQTVAVIKPDAEKNKEEIVDRIRKAGFRIADSKEIVLSTNTAEELFADHKDKEYYSDLIMHMTSGPSYFMVLLRGGAVDGWRSMIGPSDPTKAKKDSPDSIRAKYGESLLKNAVDGSSDHKHVQRTIKTVFDDTSSSLTIYIRDPNIDVDALIQKKDEIKEKTLNKETCIELQDIQFGSLILHVTIPDRCFKAKQILHKQIQSFLHKFFLDASIQFKPGHILTVVLAESDDPYADFESTKRNELEDFKDNPSTVLKLNVNVKDSAFKNEFVLYREVNRFISEIYNADVPVNGSEREVFMVEQESIVSKVELNYFKISILLLRIAPWAVRIKFDDVFPPDSLHNTLSSNHERLTDLKSNRYINQVQWNSMFPGTGDPTSQLFDTTLMICLLRNLGDVHISNQLPSPTDLSFEADLSRIKIYRKDIAFCKDRAFTNSKFTTYWAETEAAVIRLSGGKLKGECGKLKDKTYNLADRKNILYIVQAGKRLAQIENRNEVVDRIEKINSKQKFKEKQDCFEKVIKEWEEEKKWFVTTNAFNFILKNLDERVLAVVGNPGIGKSMLLHQTAIQLRDNEGYLIIPCHSPSDIVNNFRKETKQVFILDDVCGQFTLVQAYVDQWNKYEIRIQRFLQKKNSIILVSCRSQIFREKQCQSLFIFSECLCDMNENDYASDIQKLEIANRYLSQKTVSEVKPNVGDFGMFPLSCRLYREKEGVPSVGFFQDPFYCYKVELDDFNKEDGGVRCCSLFLCVLHNGCLNQEILMDESESDFSQTLETIFANFRLNPRMSRQRIIESLETLLNRYLTKRNDQFHVLHDRLFDFLCHYFGQHYQQLIIKYADSEIIRDRTLLKSLQTSPQEYTILIDTKYENAYFDRLIWDMLSGFIDDVLYNHQIRNSNFRVKFLSHLKELDDVFITRVLSEFVTDENEKSSQLLPVNFACKYGYRELFEFFLSKTKDVNAYEGSNIPLITACRKGDRYMTGLLLKKGADVNQTDALGCSPLLWSCVYGNWDIIQMLLQKNVDIENVEVCSMSSPLIWACFGEFLQFCESADIARKVCTSAHANEIFSVAVENINDQFCSHEHVIEFLLVMLRDGHSQGSIFAKENLLLNNPPELRSAMKKMLKIINDEEIDIYDDVSTRCMNNNPTQPFIEIMNLFLDRGVDIDKRSKGGLTALFFACKVGIYKGSQSIRHLLSKGASVNKSDIDGIYPLHIAIYSEREDLVKLLIEKNAIVNCSSHGHTPLVEAVERQNISLVEVLIQNGASLNHQFENGATLLHHVIKFNNVDLIYTLLKGGIAVNCKNNPRNTPLMIAVNHGLPNIVDVLIKEGADVNSMNCDKITPLMIAVNKQNVSIAKALIQHGADIGIRFENGATLLHHAIKFNNVDLIYTLLKGGIAVNCKNNFGETPLMIAVNLCLANIVDVLIKEGANVNISSSNKITPLMIAVNKQNVSIAKTLIQHGADIDILFENRVTLLHRAIKFNDVDLIYTLLKGGIAVNCKNNSGITPLMVAVDLGLPNIVEILIKEGAIVNTWNSCKMTPLMVASSNGDYNIVEIILKKKQEFTEYQTPEPLFLACRNNHLKVVCLLLKYGCDINSSDPEYGNTCLLEACCKGFESMVNLLLENGANINASNHAGDTSLTMSSMHGHASIVRLLIERGADMYQFNKNGDSALYLACINNKFEVVKVLLVHGYYIDNIEKDEKQTCLLVASNHAYDKIVAYLIKHGADVNTKNYLGNTPLMLAASKGHLDIVHMLIEHKADVNIRNDEGSTSLSLASSEGLDKIVAYLIEHGGNVNTQSNIGTTPLILAASNCHLNIVKMLIESKADVNIQDEKGSTCLLLASSKGFDNIVTYLIDQKANIDAMDNSGDSPLMLATKYGHASTVKILLKNGAQVNIKN